ncbi:zinc finger BED domain-containing protein RICESLEEPER 2-like [Pistacia vera]|uniref:zinc finger BED domain-containing protein RICESLEEPER 2-like n=1 Tax=Pistacia vera TaxID=55513 RepID=UPI001262E8FE|nr:zinc finger BED domain-containing protein RICESLEEPER 2-like [Pistacia vera]
MQLVEDIFETWSDDDATPAGTPGDGVNASTPRTNEEQVNHFQRKKRPKTSAVWNEFKEVVLPDGSTKGECIHCKAKLAITETKSTTQFARHLKSCLKQIDAKFDMNKMRELAANWVLMHEHPFTVVGEEGFNMMQKCGMPLWEKITRTALKQHCVTVYEIQKKKLVNLLKSINKISLTTDIWNSSNQKLEYMVLTGHFIDNDWKLQKCVLNFVHIPAPRPGVEIVAVIHKCLIEWGIENKVFSISVDNASSNDAAIKILRENLGRNKKLMCGGRLFHVRCAAHILNLMVQDELSQIKPIIQDMRDCILYVKQSETRVIMFLEIVHMLQLPKRKLILDCKTRWNSTYEMLALAIQYRDVFPMLVQLDNNFTCALIDEDWEKLEKVCEILEVFNLATNVISGSEFPTFNLFL